MKELLSLLKQNARLSNAELAAMLGRDEATVAKQIAEMEESGIIRGYSARISQPDLGRSIHAFILIDGVPPSRRRRFLELIRSEERIAACYNIVSGGKTAMLDVYCESVEGLSQLQDRLNDISPTYTYRAAVEPAKGPDSSL